MADNPIIPFRDTLRETARAKWWFFLAFLLELVRQIHYVVCEHSTRYNMFWEDQVFGRFNKRAERMNPWTRFRISRALKFVFVSVVLCVFFAGRWDVTPIEAFFQAPSRIYDILFSTAQGLPFIFQVFMLLGLAVGQFVAIFWFLSARRRRHLLPRRHQDPVLRRLGPGPGARAGQGEHRVPRGSRGDRGARAATCPAASCCGVLPAPARRSWPRRSRARPASRSSSSTPARSSNMFFGVGVLKVKSLFRKLRKLALRYGGVIVFFDEADTLGNRGQLAQGGGWQTSNEVPFNMCCNGAHYVSEQTRERCCWSNRPMEPQAPKVGGVRGFVMGAGMGGGGGGMGTLQALLTELSGLKKPRGFFNRTVRRVLT